MEPFEFELSGVQLDLKGGAVRRDLRIIEPVPADDRLRVDCLEVGRNQRDSVDLAPEAEQLRMAAIAPRLTTKHGLSKQRFPPKRHKSKRIEVFRV